MKNNDQKKPTITLPPNVFVEENPEIGYEYYEINNPKPLTQHPVDNDSIRKLVWQIWKKRHER